MTNTNKEIANILRDISKLLEINSIPFKPRAYLKAAQSLENLSEDVSLIYKNGGLKALEKIPGVGKSIAAKIAEYLKKKKIKYYEE